MTSSAVVLGPGGPAGTAWLAGLAAGLRQAGADLGAADLIVGTSAGAIVGALLAGAGDPGLLAAAPHPSGVQPDPGTFADVLAVLADPQLARAEAIRRAGRLAASAPAGTQEAAIARMRFLAGADRWPDGPLLIPSVDADTGEAMIWDRHGAASLPEALAASTAFPGTAPPITINGHRYIDGALRAGANADLAADADLVIIADPMAHIFGPDSAAPGAGAVIRLVPDSDAIQAFGPDITSLATWVPAYQAGIRQAPQAARLIEQRVRAQRAAHKYGLPAPATRSRS